MTDNKYTGDTPITIGGKQYTLLYDWKAHAAIRTAFKDRDVHELLNGGDPADRATLLEIGLHKHHPEMTAEKIMDLSPPLIPTLAAIGKAINRSLFGEDTPPGAEGDEQNPPASAAAAT